MPHPAFALLVAAVLAQAGRPPEGPLSRSNPKRYELTWEVSLIVHPGTKGEAAPMKLDEVRFLMPWIPQDTFSRTDENTLRMTLMADTQVDPQAPGRMKLEKDLPGGWALAVMPLSNFAGQSLRCTLVSETTVWRSEIDEAKAAAIPWPSEWPEETREWLKPQWLVESDDPRFAQFVKRVAGDQLRRTTIYLAAKELIRATVAAYNGVESGGIELRAGGVMRGLRMTGAAASMAQARGTFADVSAACVATLRAAGIPARVVIGATEFDGSNQAGVRTGYIVWGEFFLPGAGWVPFDPQILRGSHGMQAKPDRPWPGVGRIKELNERVPVAFAFLPPRNQASAVWYPAAWGWMARGQVTGGTGADYVRFQMISRGSPNEQ